MSHCVTGKTLLARRLSDRLSGLVEVVHHGTDFSADPEAGRRYYVFPVADDETVMAVDDSLDQPLTEQMLGEVDRVLRFYAGLRRGLQRRLLVA